jgi:hypothetical protein
VNIALDLEYYLDRKPTHEEIAEAEEWQMDNPGSNLSEYVDAMIEIGAL